MGHWKDDPECPRAPGKAGVQTSHLAHVTLVPGPLSVMVAETGDDVWLIVVDTACAKSVAGLTWARRLCAYVKRKWGLELDRVKEHEPFRFGLGETIQSRSPAGAHGMGR